MARAKKYKILIIEDSTVRQAAVKNRIQKLGFKLEVADNGREGVSLYRSDNSIVLILIDMEIPEMDGLETLRAIRYIEEKLNMRRIPIIIFSASLSEIDKKIYLDAGCDDILLKPVDTSVLEDTLKKYIH